MRRARFVYYIVATVTLLPACTGCELVAEALKDGVADFLESTTADLLEEAFPEPRVRRFEIMK